MNGDECGSGGTPFWVRSVFSLQARRCKKKKKRAHEAFCSGYTHTHTHTHSHGHSGWQRNWVKCSLPWGGHCVFHRTSIQTQQTTGKTCGHVWEEACGNRRRGRETSWLDRSIRWKIVSVWSNSPPCLPSFFSSIIPLILSSIPSLNSALLSPQKNTLCPLLAPILHTRFGISQSFPDPFCSPSPSTTFFFFSIIVPFCYCLLVEHFCLQRWMVHCAHLSLLAVTAFIQSLSHIMSLSSLSITFCSHFLFIAFSCWNLPAFRSSAHPSSHPHVFWSFTVTLTFIPKFYFLPDFFYLHFSSSDFLRVPVSSVYLPTNI